MKIPKNCIVVMGDSIPATAAEKLAQPYIDKIVALGEELGITSGVHHVQVAHDDWCDLLKGVGPCNCNPDVSLMDPP